MGDETKYLIVGMSFLLAAGIVLFALIARAIG